ncbi:MAG: invasion protein [Methylococcaceae bacterium]|nr:invasion protein [Methylococcaceae bacterium]
MLTLHIIFVVTSILSFITRFSLLVLKPDLLKIKALKIAPHIIDTILLISGATLVIQGNWLSGEFGWIATKITVLLAYIGLGVMAMRTEGIKRYAGFVGAIVCYGYIFSVAVTKHGFF